MVLLLSQGLALKCLSSFHVPFSDLIFSAECVCFFVSVTEMSERKREFMVGWLLSFVFSFFFTNGWSFA